MLSRECGDDEEGALQQQCPPSTQGGGGDGARGPRGASGSRAPSAAPDARPASHDAPGSSVPAGARRQPPRPWGWAFAALVLTVMLAFAAQGWRPMPRPLTQKDIDQAVLHTLTTQVLPSPAAQAYEKIRRSVVRVRGLSVPDAKGEQKQLGVGTGVLVADQGLVLTNLHVVVAAPRLEVVFEDGHTSVADVVGTQPEHDLAVIKARNLPDDAQPATLRSTADLAVGDQVVAVGFPFGIGPSASAGVVSGLRREFRSPRASACSPTSSSSTRRPIRAVRAARS